MLFIDNDDCKGVVCQNGGTCEDKVNGFQCKCVEGYSGVNCETGMLYINT